MPKPKPTTFTSSLYKHNSWSPDIIRDEEWVKRKNRRRRDGNNNMKSVTDDDIDEFKACIELGFGFDEVNHQLSDTLPALPFYYAVNKRFQDSSSLTGSPVHPLFDAGDDPEMMKTRLKQWAQVVACTLRQSSSSSSLSSQGDHK